MLAGAGYLDRAEARRRAAALGGSPWTAGNLAVGEPIGMPSGSAIRTGSEFSARPHRGQAIPDRAPAHPMTELPGPVAVA